MTRVCKEPGCPNLQPCTTHPDWKNKPRSPSSRATGNSQWRRLRLKVLERDMWICRHCGERATQVDHLHPVAHGGNNTSSNLVASCAPCNQARKPR